MLYNSIKILIFLLFSTFSWAQYTPKMFEFGPKIGGNVVRVSNFEGTAIKNKLSIQYQVGVFTRFNKGKFSLQPEFTYQVKGGVFKDGYVAPTVTTGIPVTPIDVTNTLINSKQVYKYVSIPVLVGYTFMKGVYLETGPEFNMSVNKGYKKDGASIYGPDKISEQSWILGARINMLDMLSLYSLNLRYTQGLTNVSTTKNPRDNKTLLDLRTRTFQLGVTYTFSEYYSWKRKYGVKKKK